MDANKFADKLRSLELGHWFINRIAVRVSTVPVIAGPPREPQRVYYLLGQDFYSAASAAKFAVAG